MTETLRQKQSRQCVQCGAFFATSMRGLLCHGCNIAAGSLKDDPSRAERLAIYLRRGGYE